MLFLVKLYREGEAHWGWSGVLWDHFTLGPQVKSPVCSQFPNGVRRIPYKAEWKHVWIGDVSWHEGRSEGQDPEKEMASDLARAVLSSCFLGRIYAWIRGSRALCVSSCSQQCPGIGSKLCGCWSWAGNALLCFHMTVNSSVGPNLPWFLKFWVPDSSLQGKGTAPWALGSLYVHPSGDSNNKGGTLGYLQDNPGFVNLPMFFLQYKC